MSTAHKDWIRRRVEAVRSVYTAFDALTEHGHGEMIHDQDTASQLSCPVHGPDTRPSARYYPKMGGDHDYLHCYTCKIHADSLNLFMKFKGLPFMEALKDLERRFRIRVPERPDSPELEEPLDRSSSSYVSAAWQNVERVIPILERKLLRLRDTASMIDYVKFCRVLDAVQWDLDRNDGKPTPQMILILDRLRKMMDSVRPFDLDFEA
ncbi:hypothetical protein LCGC14_2358010 [marine sediment metagenome]|uniref:Zinc finger CHC2-type domain-containing protein n=1 Tax=marine sediment metagenome TaxID=412755 RepID=A0A0F9C794_9ZZZZ